MRIISSIILSEALLHSTFVICGSGLLYATGAHFSLAETVSTLGGLMCLVGFILQSRKNIRDNLEDVETPVEEQRKDKRAFRYGFAYIALGTLVWALAGLVLK